MTADVIVLGTGGVGSAAMFHLARRGVSVLGLDRFAPGHDRGSSHGETRLIRQAYFEHPDYVPLVMRAYALWAELEQVTGVPLYHQTGILQAGPPGGTIVPGVLASAAQHALSVEQLTAREVEQRFPGFRTGDRMEAVFESRAGFLRVEECVKAHLKESVAAGAELHSTEVVLHWEPTASGVEVTTSRARYSAGALVIAAGAWAGSLLRDLKLSLKVVRKSLYWFATNDARYEVQRGTPGFIFETPGGNYYGFPQIGPLGVKAAEHSRGHPVDDPLRVDRAEDPVETARVREFLAQHLPGVSSTTTRFETCLYTLSPDQNFLVDRHPVHRQVCFVAGLSGHGFKFASVLGEILADLALAGDTSQPIDFLSVGRFSKQQ